MKSILEETRFSVPIGRRYQRPGAGVTCCSRTDCWRATRGACDAQASGYNPYAAKQPHFPPRAKRVISLFMSGGVSHLDTFDPEARA